MRYWQKILGRLRKWYCLNRFTLSTTSSPTLVGFFVCVGHSDIQHSHLEVYFIYGIFISIFTLHCNTGIIIMDISKSFLKQFFTSIVFIATFGVGHRRNTPHQKFNMLVWNLFNTRSLKNELL